MREIPVGLLGLGNVGSGVVKLLGENADAIAARIGARLSVRAIGVQSADKPRLVDPGGVPVTTDLEAIVDDPAIRVVVELIGGEEPARTLVLRAFERGKHVVTANKLLLARHGDELFAAAERAGALLFYEASVCVGVPVLRMLREGLASDRITQVMGIVNGTSNFILSKMAEEGRAFDDVLAEAQREGYAEADPTLDVGGGDAAHKLAILTALSFRTRVKLEDVHVEGITHVTPTDFRYAERFGCAIKLLAVAVDDPDGICAYVGPAMVPKRWMLAGVAGVYNAIYVSSYALGQSMYYGRGAGMMPTAVAVLSDLIEVGREVLLPAERGGRALHFDTRPFRSIAELKSRFYLRFSVEDRPGVLATLATGLAEHSISIAELVQEAPEGAAGPVTIVMTTHEAREGDVRQALGRLDRAPVVREPTRMFRMMGGG